MSWNTVFRAQKRASWDILKTYVNSSHKKMHINSEVKKIQKPRNRKSQRAKSMSSTYLQHVLHWLYFITSFSSEIACYRKMILLQNIYFYLRSHWEKFHFSFIVLTFCSKGHILLQVPRANFCTFLNNIWTFLLPPVSNSRKFEKLSHISWRILDALLMHFSFFLHFTNFAKINKNFT